MAKNESIVFRLVTKDSVEKGSTITIEGTTGRITSINTVNPLEGGYAEVIGRFKESDISKWRRGINRMGRKEATDNAEN